MLNRGMRTRCRRRKPLSMLLKPILGPMSLPPPRRRLVRCGIARRHDEVVDAEIDEEERLRSPPPPSSSSFSFFGAICASFPLIGRRAITMAVFAVRPAGPAGLVAVTVDVWTSKGIDGRRQVVAVVSRA